MVAAKPKRKYRCSTVSQGYLIGLPQRVVDADGLPLDGGLIYTWVADGTFTTPLTTWSDAGLTSANTNPIEADASGYFRAFVAAGTNLDIQVKNASGVLQYTLLSQEPMVNASGGAISDATISSSTFSQGNIYADVKVLAADATATSSATLANLTGFSWTLVAAGTYAFVVRGKVGMTTNGGLAVAFKYTTATLTSIVVNATQRTASAFALAQSTTTTDQTKFINQKATAYIDVELQGSLVVNVGGTLAVQFAQETSHADTTTVYKGFVGSFVRTS